MTDCLDCDEEKNERITEENKKKENSWKKKWKNSWFGKNRPKKSSEIDDIKLEKNLLNKKKEKRTSISLKI